MNLSDTRIGTGLRAIVRPTRESRSGIQSLGRAVGSVLLPDATTIYQLTSAPLNTTDQWFLTLSTGIASDMVSGGDGFDVEGNAISLTHIYALEIRCLTGEIYITNDYQTSVLFTGDVFRLQSVSGYLVSLLDPFVIASSADGSTFDLICIGS